MLQNKLLLIMVLIEEDIYFNKDNIIVDEGKYITNWQRFNEKKEISMEIKINMFSSNIMHQPNDGNKLELMIISSMNGVSNL